MSLCLPDTEITHTTPGQVDHPSAGVDITGHPISPRRKAQGPPRLAVGERGNKRSVEKKKRPRTSNDSNVTPPAH